jgi:TonB family protein
VDLFSDPDLRGWLLVPAADQPARVVDGVLDLPRKAWLLHPRIYSDLVLHLSFRLRSRDARLGVLFRGRWEQRQGTLDADYGYEWWLKSGKSPDVHLVIQRPEETVRVPNRDPGVRDAMLPVDEWQSLSVLATADRFQVWLNGSRIAEAWGGPVRAGLVGLRALDGAVEVRRAALRDLTREPLFEQALEAGVHLDAPRLVKDVRPRYVASAIRRKVAGEVVVECVVREDGSVGAVRLVHSLDPDLDAETLSAVRQWQFEPPRRDGEPVKVRFAITIEFGKGKESDRRPGLQTGRSGAP